MNRMDHQNLQKEINDCDPDQPAIQSFEQFEQEAYSNLLDPNVADHSWENFDFDAMINGAPCQPSMTKTNDNEHDDEAEAIVESIDVKEPEMKDVENIGHDTISPNNLSVEPTIGSGHGCSLASADFEQPVPTTSNNTYSDPSSSYNGVVVDPNPTFMSPLIGSRRRSYSLPPTDISFHPRHVFDYGRVLLQQPNNMGQNMTVDPMVFHRTPTDNPLKQMHQPSDSQGAVATRSLRMVSGHDFIENRQFPHPNAKQTSTLGGAGSRRGKQIRGDLATMTEQRHGNIASFSLPQPNPAISFLESESRNKKMDKTDGRVLRRVHKTVRKQRLTLATGSASEKKLFWDELLGDLDHLRELAYKGMESFGGSDGGGGGEAEGDKDVMEIEQIRTHQRSTNNSIQSLDSPLQILAGTRNYQTTIPPTGRAIKELDSKQIDSVLKAYGIPYASEMFVFEKKMLYLRYVGVGKELMHLVLD